MRTADEYIARCDGAIKNADQLKPADFERLSNEVCCAFNPVIPKISYYRGGLPGPYTVEDIKQLRGKIAVYRDEKDHELEIAKLNAAARGATVILSDVGNSKAEASVVARVTISQAFDAVDADPDLSEEQKAELQGLLAQAKGAAAKGDGDLFARIGSKVMESVEKATPGLVVKVLEFLLGLAMGGL